MRNSQNTRALAILGAFPDVPRFFSLLQAEQMLPEVERLVRSLVEAKRDYDSGDAELDAIKQRITLLGGVSLARETVLASRTRREAAARTLKSVVEKITELGVQIKDPDTGLIDFPTLYRDREVYLCWRLGEPSIGFWHNVEDGFRGRQAIDREFLENHRGDDEAPN
ncbi:MAG: DUF2203 domain-containing protein [Bryobacteraceae bacterium]